MSGESGRTITIVLSAKSKTALKAMAARWLEYENSKDDAQIVASWLVSKRYHYSNRMVVFANSSNDFRNKMQDFIDGKANSSTVEGTAPPTFQAPKSCFVFPGQGQQWSDMGRSLYANEPIYRAIVHSPQATITPHAPPPPPQDLREWYHFVQETHLIEIPHVTSKKVGTYCMFRSFFKMAASRK